MNAALAPSRAILSDFQATNYIISSATGKKLVIDDIQAVWGAYEKLTGVVFDPIDPDVLDHLDPMCQ